MSRPVPNLANRDLLDGDRREDYFEYGVPLYEASIKCDWEAAYAILVRNPELVKYSITENGETALHIAASAKGPKPVEQFVKNLVGLMSEEDLEIVNKNHNTALYLAAAAGNLETVKIMVQTNKGLLTIPGAGGTMMPLYAAVLFGNYEVVKYLYNESKGGGNPRSKTTRQSSTDRQIRMPLIRHVQIFRPLGKICRIGMVISKKNSNVGHLII